MKHFLLAASIAALSVGAMAQDKITLANGDVLTGKITTMAGGNVTISSPLLKDLTVPLSTISDLTTGEMVTLRTKSGDTWQRRIIGIEGGSLRLEGGETSTLALDNLGMINPPEKVAPKWTGSLQVSALYADGNTSRRAGGLLFDASRKTEVDRLTVDAQWQYGEDKDVNRFQSDGVTANPNFRNRTLTQRRAGAGIKYDYFLSKRWYALVTSRVLGDTLADLNLRFTAGLGAGYTVIDDGDTLFLTEFGLAYFNEDYRTPGLASTDGMALRIAWRLEKQLSDDTKLVHRTEAFPSVEDSDDFYLQAITEISTKLTDDMVASVSHTLDYDNTPALNRQRADNRVLLSIGWTF